MTQPVTTSQIDRLGDRLRHSAVSGADIRLLDTYRRTFAVPYEAVVGVIRDRLSLEPTGRPSKSTSSIVEKLRRDTIRLSQLQDIAGCRLIVPDVMAQDHVVEQLQASLPNARVVDRRSHPRFGYRAVHVIAAPDGMSVEVQIRSSLQHLWAELSEKLSDIVDPAIKYGGGAPRLHELLSHTSQLVTTFEQSERQLASIPQTLKTLSANIAALEEMKRQLIESPPTSQSAAHLEGIARRLDDAHDRLFKAQNYLLDRQKGLIDRRREIGELLRQIGNTIATVRGDEDALSDTI